MQEFMVFNGAHYPFQIFSSVHLIPLGILCGLGLMLSLFRKPLQQGKANQRVRYTAAAILFLQEVSYHIWTVANGIWHPGFTLPLHLCGLSALLSGIMLVNRRYKIFEIVYFWGLGGAGSALLTPDIGVFSFPHYLYYKFFISHGLIVLAVLFLTIVENYRPTWKSIGRVFIITNVYAVLVGIINYSTGGNYLYLRAKPQGASLFDYLGPWPWYIVSLEGVLLLVCLICYIPYILKDWQQESGFTQAAVTNQEK